MSKTVKLRPPHEVVVDYLKRWVAHSAACVYDERFESTSLVVAVICNIVSHMLLDDEQKRWVQSQIEEIASSRNYKKIVPGFEEQGGDPILKILKISSR